MVHMIKLIFYLIRIAVNVNPYTNLRSVCATQLLEMYFDLAFNRIDICARKQPFKKFHLTLQIDLIEADYYQKQVFHLLYDNCYVG